MSQSDGEPAWQGKTYDALKDKKTLDRNKQGRSPQERGMRITPYLYFDIDRKVDNFWSKEYIKTQIMCADYSIADSLKIPISSNNTGYAKEILVGLTSGGEFLTLPRTFFLT